MSDLVVRLRNYIPGENQDWVAIRISEAADEIERLTARLATIEQETVERCAKIAEDHFDPARSWSADTDMQNQGYYTAGEISSEIADKIRSTLTSPDEANGMTARKDAATESNNVKS